MTVQTSPTLRAAKFCTEYSISEGEPLSGWGAHQIRNILIRWPKGKWHQSMRLAGGMTPGMEAAIGRVYDAGWRVNLIDRKSCSGERITVFLMPDALAFDLEVGALEPFLDAVPQGRAAIECYGPRPLDAPLILCCTHGKHDRCCAKWGFGAYKAVAAEAERRGGFDVWECTHLGGCRLSATVMVMPAMRKYGRMTPVEAAPLLAAEAEDHPYVAHYRGASHLEPAAQVAEVTALAAIAPTGPHRPARLTETDTPGPARRFTVLVAGHAADILCRPDTVCTYGACTDLHADTPPEDKQIWRGETLSLTRMEAYP